MHVFCVGYEVNHVSCDRTSFPGSKCFQYKEGTQGGKVVKIEKIHSEKIRYGLFLHCLSDHDKEN
jgi:hypothetical protein